MTSADDDRGVEPRGDAADQAADLVAFAEQDAIRAALAGRPGGDDDPGPRDGVVDLQPDEPLLDFGAEDDSDDPAHGGGDDVAMTPSGGPREPHEAHADGMEVVTDDDLMPRPPTDS